MNSWSRKRKRIILTLVFSVLLFLIGAPLFFLFYHAPNCFDGKKNGDEIGVDCGGSCQLLCTSESLPLILKGDPRVIKVRDNLYEVVALVDNPNSNGEIYEAGYTIKIFSALSSVPIKIIEGETFVPKGSVFAIFEGPFELVGGSMPSRATLEWKGETLIWQQNNRSLPEIVIKNMRLSGEKEKPRLDLDLENISFDNVANIELVALIFNASSNIFAASKTFVDSLPARSMAPAVFTWPEPFTDDAVDIDVIIRIFPDRRSILR